MIFNNGHLPWRPSLGHLLHTHLCHSRTGMQLLPRMLKAASLIFCVELQPRTQKASDIILKNFLCIFLLKNWRKRKRNFFLISAFSNFVSLSFHSSRWSMGWKASHLFIHPNRSSTHSLSMNPASCSKAIQLLFSASQRDSYSSKSILIYLFGGRIKLRESNTNTNLEPAKHSLIEESLHLCLHSMF